SMVRPDQTLSIDFDSATARHLLIAAGYAGGKTTASRASLVVTYSYGGFTATTSFVRTAEKGSTPIRITRGSCVPASKIEGIFKNPFANLPAARTAPLKIQRAYIGQVPSTGHGWLVALGLYV